MRLRRLELAILAITLAFGFFMGGFFTGRSRSAVSIPAAVLQAGDGTGTHISISQLTPAAPGPVPAIAVTAEPGKADAAAPQTPQVMQQTVQQVTDSSAAEQGTGAPRNSDGKININTASLGELTDLPGIGNTLAARIIDYRTQSGDFAKIEDIRKVSGIGERRFEAIKDLITTN